MKKIIIITYALFAFLLVGCTPTEYTGDYPELYTVAVYSIPDTSGYFKTEIVENPRIELLETDEYGRKLFLYFEGHNISTFSLVIMQYSTQTDACFYSMNNFISSPTEEFSDVELSILKENNDWNRELQEEKAICSPITTAKAENPITYNQMNPLYEIVFSEEERYFDDRALTYFITDQYGRILISSLSRSNDEWALMLFNADGSYDAEKGYIIFTDFYTYQEEMRTFLENVDWNEPFE